MYVYMYNSAHDLQTRSLDVTWADTLTQFIFLDDTHHFKNDRLKHKQCIMS